jgi:hypothetical protein
MDSLERKQKEAIHVILQLSPEKLSSAINYLWAIHDGRQTRAAYLKEVTTNESNDSKDV